MMSFFGFTSCLNILNLSSNKTIVDLSPLSKTAYISFCLYVGALDRNDYTELTQEFSLSHDSKIAEHFLRQCRRIRAREDSVNEEEDDIMLHTHASFSYDLLSNCSSGDDSNDGLGKSRQESFQGADDCLSEATGGENDDILGSLDNCIV